MERDSTKRFGSRVEHYVRYRPHYPESVLKFLQTELKLIPSSVIADIGSGTGISSQLFLSAGNKVFGVEPNSSMRSAGEQYLAAYPNFVSVDGKAEATGLADQSIDFIVAGQAFHWFERDSCRIEFKRILRPSGSVVLLWNDRRQDTSFSHAYENLLRTYAIDYDVVDHRQITMDVLQQFYGSKDVGFKMFDNEQIFDLQGLQGRVLSCSYMPTPGHPRFDEMIQALSSLFQRFQEDDRISMGYNTLMYYGKLH